MQILIVLSIWSLSFFQESNSYECERDKSRTVRDVIYREMYPVFREAKVKIPPECPFYKDRDRYLVQEEHKDRESLTRWSCNFCGKAFIGEIYLDSHFTNRHADTINMAENSVCLADYCEIFRCDVLSGVATANFWDVVLCMEEDMADLKQDCKETLDSCIPDSVVWNVSNKLKASLDEKICSYLTCKRYWDAPSLEEKQPPGSGYIVFSILLGVCLIIYYCVAINYFFLDTFSDPYDYDDVANPESLSTTEQITIRYPKSPSGKRKKTTARPAVIQTEAQDPENIFNMGHIEGVSLRTDSEGYR